MSGHDRVVELLLARNDIDVNVRRGLCLKGGRKRVLCAVGRHSVGRMSSAIRSPSQAAKPNSFIASSRICFFAVFPEAILGSSSS